MRAVCTIASVIRIVPTMPDTSAPLIDVKLLPLLLIFFLGPCLIAGETTRSRGIAAFQHGNYTEAESLLNQAIRENGSDVSAQVFLALTQRRATIARQHFRCWPPSNQADEMLARLSGIAAARCETAKGDGGAALNHLLALKQRFPKDADVLYELARFHMKSFNDATFAMFERTPSSYRVHQLSAEVFEVQGRFDEAVDEYRKACAMNPSAPDLHYRLGRALLMRSHEPAALTQAAEAFTAELKLNPEDAATEFQLGQIAQVQGNAAAAKDHFTRALSLSADFPEALIALGKLESQQKQYEQAIALLLRAVHIQPANEAARYALMMAYRDSGQMEKAKAEKTELDRHQRPPEGEFNDFLKKLGEKPARP